jgi:apolipoprotein N-acyltransferase
LNTKSNTPFSILILLAGALLVGFSMGRWLTPLAAWIGPVLILRYARDHKPGRGFLAIMAAYILAFLIGFGEMWLTGPFPQPLVPFLAVLYGFLWSLPYLADRLVSPRLQGFPSTFIYPLAAATLEFVNIHTNPIGAWGATGFTQYGNLPLMQLASVTGMIGITFLMGWFASVANWAWENRTRSREIIRGLAVFGIVLAVVLAFGILRLNLTPSTESDETMRVAGITTVALTTLNEQAEGVTDLETLRKLTQSRWDAFFNETIRDAQAGASLIVWTEASGATLNLDEPSYIARVQDVARQNGIYIAAGLMSSSLDASQPFENKLLIVGPSGEIVLEHIKYGGNFFEGSRRGDGKLQIAATPMGVLSGVICWDMDFPAVLQQAGWNGTGLMLVPSRDWFEIDPLHSHMAVFRAIENGMSIVRQTDEGLSLAADPYGRVLAQSDFFGTTDRTLVAQVPVKHVKTLYNLFGRWLEWLAPLGFVFVVGWALIGRRQMK